MIVISNIKISEVEIDEYISKHRKLIVLFVKGIKNKREYSELSEWLSNCDPAIEKAQGIIFDPTMSRIILRLNQQITEESQLAEITGYIADMLDHTLEWKLVKYGKYTIMIDKE
mgnify:CR=1 FL=1